MTLPWRAKKWNGSSWVNCELRRFDGSNWVAANAYSWNGSGWALMTDRTPPTQTYKSDFGSVWSWGYQGNNTKRSDSEVATNGKRFQGRYDSVWGVQKSMYGHDYLSWRAYFGGATAYYSCYLNISCNHTYWNAGGTVVLGVHNAGGSAPNNFSYTGYETGSAKMTAGQNININLSTTHIGWAANGTSNGFILYQESNDFEYYGYWGSYVVFSGTYEK